jgi:magnesium transporter
MSTSAVLPAKAADDPRPSVGALMEPALATLPPTATVGEAIEHVRALSRRTQVTYLYVIDAEHRLVGVIAMRDLLLNAHERVLSDVMLRSPFWLRPELPVLEAMRQVLDKHFPCYPVCDAEGRLIGQVWGHRLAAVEAFELSAQAGAMVGVVKEELTSTPWLVSLRFRHPWLQLNLLTAFVAAAVVGIFETTIEQIVVLAVFLPVLAGQSGNTGCQALAVTLRGMTLGELKRGRERAVLLKELRLGAANGFLVGLTSGLGMFIYATLQKTSQPPLLLALVVCVAMIAACIVSGLTGVLTPLALRRLGADPATASSIFLTTATDVASMGCFLGLATWWLL